MHFSLFFIAILSSVALAAPPLNPTNAPQNSLKVSFKPAVTISKQFKQLKLDFSKMYEDKKFPGTPFWTSLLSQQLEVKSTLRLPPNADLDALEQWIRDSSQVKGRLPEIIDVIQEKVPSSGGAAETDVNQEAEVLSEADITPSTQNQPINPAQPAAAGVGHSDYFLKVYFKYGLDKKPFEALQDEFRNKYKETFGEENIKWEDLTNTILFRREPSPKYSSAILRLPQTADWNELETWIQGRSEVGEVPKILVVRKMLPYKEVKKILLTFPRARYDHANFKEFKVAGNRLFPFIAGRTNHWGKINHYIPEPIVTLEHEDGGLDNVGDWAFLRKAKLSCAKWELVEDGESSA